VRKIADDYVMR